MDLAKLCAELGIPADSAISITGYDLLDWGRIVRLACTYRQPDGATMAFTWRFDDVREMRWRLYLHHQGDSAALVDLSLGTGAHRKPAQLLTEAFALTVLYDTYALSPIA